MKEKRRQTGNNGLDRRPHHRSNLPPFGYGNEYFSFALIAGIMIKKSWMIQKAGTVQELEEILKPSVPIWNYGNFITGPYHVLEEEAILWSKASLEAPLNDDGIKRYAKVFSQFYPEKAAEIWRKELAV